jgi:hypothetical protein
VEQQVYLQTVVSDKRDGLVQSRVERQVYLQTVVSDKRDGLVQSRVEQHVYLQTVVSDKCDGLVQSRHHLIKMALNNNHSLDVTFSRTCECRLFVCVLIPNFAFSVMFSYARNCLIMFFSHENVQMIFHHPLIYVVIEMDYILCS